LLVQLRSLRTEAVGLERELEPLIAAVHPGGRSGARNLVHYLSLRQRDLRPLQDQLASCGLSSLGRSEPQVLATLDAIVYLLERALRSPADEVEPAPPVRSMRAGEHDLEAEAADLLGPEPEGRRVRIMVTLDGAVLDEPTLIRDLIQSGMDCARINCAHDDPRTWRALAERVRATAAEVGRSCRIDMDLPGPKLRTGPLSSGPGVVRWRVRREADGQVVEPARVWLTPMEAPLPAPAVAQVNLPVPGAWLQQLEVGDRLTIEDRREKQRRLKVVAADGVSRLAECKQGAYIGQGALLERSSTASGDGQRWVRVGQLPSVEQPLVLFQDDLLDLTRPTVPGEAAELDANRAVVRPAHIGCTAPQVFEDVRVGEEIWFDDGKIGGTVVQASSDELRVKITHANARGARLRPDKGINLPETELRLPALSEQDLRDLDVIAECGDLVALSFANRPEDVVALRAALAVRTRRPPGIVLKIETRRGFQNLPRLLLEVLHSRPVGVMIARGDLAVECGYDRLAEVQEEMLWLCEAAHVPVIWATQVLEQLAKAGRPSRAEITDAAMGVRAECVMLNKGPHTVEAVQMLDNILRRMQAHQRKKRTLFRKLAVSFAPLDDVPLVDHGRAFPGTAALAEHPQGGG
jgi:pyruvate kinase